MPKKKTTYLGGEVDPPRVVTPRTYGNFFSRHMLFSVLLLLLLAAMLVILWV
jgi:hypothetical protein